MSRVQLGSRWREIPLIVRALMLPSTDQLITCDDCGAAWWPHEGFPDECKWCTEALENQRRWQAELVLTPPDIDPQDATFDGVMQGWAERLAVAVEAELITRHQAETAWGRAVAA